MVETVSFAFRSGDNSPFVRHLTLRHLLCLILLLVLLYRWSAAFSTAAVIFILIIDGVMRGETLAVDRL
jgi:hypothetical protein